MQAEKRKTFGQYATELMLKPDHKQGIIDTQREMTKNFLPEVQKCIETHEKLWKDPFYVVVINKRERLFVNCIRQYFLARQTLPTPDLDQTVFKYTPATGDLRYLWTVSDHGTIEYMIRNKHLVPSEQRQLLEFNMLFQEGKLDAVHGC